MGNAIARLNTCLCPTAAGDISRRIDLPEKAFRGNQQLDDNGLGHSFCYIPSHHFAAISSSSSSSSSSFGGAHPARMVPLFRAISGASISANTSTQLSTALYLDSYSLVIDRASSFESSSCFASVPLQPIPRGFMVNSGPLTSHTSGSLFGSGPMERGFLSGPIERGFTSGPIQDEVMSTKSKYKLKKWGSIKGIKESILASIWGPRNGYDSVNQTEWENSNSNHKYNGSVGKSNSIGRVSGSLCEDTDGGGGGAVSSGGLLEEQNYEWAQGKAGEDRVHIVVSQDQGWLFVGIYDGFNGPDAPDFLLSNLYSAVHDELKGLFPVLESESEVTMVKDSSKGNGMIEVVKHELGRCDGNENSIEVDDKTRKRMNKMGVKWWDKVRHSEVVKALSEALRKTEESYLDIADKMVKENPELCLMGSCLLVMLMMGEDIYLMNVGDSRAVLGQKSVDLDSIDDISSLQLTMDHNTYVKEEVKRIRNRHLDDPSALVNHRVKGSLKVTRAFGAGFLKHPKWNEALLKSFRIEYVGNLPYITCRPSLSHHKLSPRDKFLILSSDGLFQYFTNDEAVSEVELFMASTPEGDPAQHLIEEVLFRAAKRAGMDFHELLEIPQGERRRYHDDVSVIVISLEGTIWRSSV